MSSSRVGSPTVHRRTSRRHAWIVASVVALVALSAVSAAGAANRPAPTKADGAGKFTPVNVPLGVSNRPQTVIVQLSGDPVAVADANSPTAFDQSQWNSHRDQLRQTQAPVESQIQSLGGHVLASYQLAYNGIKVQIAGGKENALASLPGVVAVHPVQIVQPDNVHGVPLVGGPAVWGGVPGLAGEHIKIADIDTGIDYTHADFGGPGTVAAYQQAFSSDTADPSLPTSCLTPALTPCFGPLAPKVKGGTDLVGDAYNADPAAGAAANTPHPDPNPLDCNSHGTHTAGTAAGFGVLSDGSTYTGPYNATTVSDHTWNVGPGVAPKADLYAVRVFGCDGSTNMVTDAIEWAVANHMDVINMSLGSDFGSPDSPDAVAATNAARDGVIVIASSGNEGKNAYMTGTPASSPGALSVAASDPTQVRNGADVTLTSGTAKVWLSNNASFTSPVSGDIYVVPPDPTSPFNGGADTGPVGFGCDPADYAAGAGKIIVAQRTSLSADPGCGRVQRAIYGENAGAIAVVLVNNAAGYPPIEGNIHNPSTGVPVAIPFFGALASDRAKFVAANGTAATFTPDPSVPNPLYLALASFSSWGPATGDSSLKPNVTAPGVSIASAGMGTGNGPQVDSGTSMAAPHTTGVAALVKQAHPDWRKVKYWEAAISNTADPGMVNGYQTRGAGTGFIQAVPATQTQVVALGSMGRGGWDDDDNHEGGRHGGNAQTATLSFGFNELDRDFNQSATVQLRNFSNAPQTFTVSDQLDQGSPHSLSIDNPTVTVGPRSERDVRVRLSVPLATAGGASYPGITPFTDVSGLVTFTPAAGSNNGVTLRVPYYMVPQAVSHISTNVSTRHGVTTATTRNRSQTTGNADWYAWGIKDSRTHALGSNDIRAVGASSFPSDGYMQFAISTYHRWSNASQNEFDIYVDVNNDGAPDYVLVAADQGALQTGIFNGVNVDAVFDLNEGGGILEYVVDAPTDSSTTVLPVDLSAFTDSNPATSLDGVVNKRFTYWVVGNSLIDNTQDAPSATAKFNPFTPAVSAGMFDTVAGGGTATEPLTINSAEQALSPALGWMVVSHENPSGSDEAQLLDLRSVRRR